MKYLIMTEGTCEKAVLDVFIEKKILKYKIDDLLYEEIHHARQIKGDLLEKINQLPSKEKIQIIRIVDKSNNVLKIPKEIKEKIQSIKTICIKPEFEILYIIYLNKYNEYMKNKSFEKPSSFLYKNFKEYKKHYQFNYDFFISLTIDEIYLILNEYNKIRYKTHKEDEYSLTSLIK